MLFAACGLLMMLSGGMLLPGICLMLLVRLLRFMPLFACSLILMVRRL